NGASSIHSLRKSVLESRLESADSVSSGYHLQICNFCLRRMASAGMGRRPRPPAAGSYCKHRGTLHSAPADPCKPRLTPGDTFPRINEIRAVIDRAYNRFRLFARASFQEASCLTKSSEEEWTRHQ